MCHCILSSPVARLNTFLRSHNKLLKIRAENIPEALENLQVVFFRKNYYIYYFLL